MTVKSLISMHFCSKIYIFELITLPKTIIYGLKDIVNNPNDHVNMQKVEIQLLDNI